MFVASRHPRQVVGPLARRSFDGSVPVGAVDAVVDLVVAAGLVVEPVVVVVLVVVVGFAVVVGHAGVVVLVAGFVHVEVGLVLLVVVEVDFGQSLVRCVALGDFDRWLVFLCCSLGLVVLDGPLVRRDVVGSVVALGPITVEL